MARYSVKKVDKYGKVIKNFKEWRAKHKDELYHDSMLNYEFYHELKRRGIRFDYQRKFVLQPKFKFLEYCIKTTKGVKKLGWHERSVQAITWSPDFPLTDYNVVIEAKGRVQETFPNKLKMFKYYVTVNDLNLRVVVLRSIDELKRFLDSGLNV